MTEQSRLWDNGSYTDENFSEVLNRLVCDGVLLGVTNELAVTAGSGMSVVVGTGEGWCHGSWYCNDAAKTLAIAASDPSNPRIDLVVLRRSASANTLLLAVLTGTPAGSPSVPSLTQTAATWEISLAQIAVGAGVTSINAGNITAIATSILPVSGVPKNFIGYTTDASAPKGFAEWTAGRGRMIVGVPSGGTIAGTVGTALTNLQDKTHTHTGPSHTHTGASHQHQYYSGPNSGQATASAGADASNASGTGATGTAATSDVAPYIQLLAIQRV